MTIRWPIRGPGIIPVFGSSSSSSSSAGTNPQLQYFENFPGHLGTNNVAYSNGTLSVHAVNIPLSISFNNVVALISFGSDAGGISSFQGSIQFGLYSMNAGTLSLENSAGKAVSVNGGNSWISMVTSATENVTPGAWYFGFNIFTNGVLPHTSASFYANSSIAPGNAIPGGFIMGHVTASTNAMPTSIATSDLDITGGDAIRQPYIILTA